LEAIKKAFPFFYFRREALSGLALIYKNYLMDPDNAPQATKSAIGWISDKILHGTA